MLDWDAPDVQVWKKEARALQQNMFLILGEQEWGEFDRRDETLLHLRIGFFLYSFPDNSRVQNNTGYNQQQMDKIKPISDSILRNAKRGNTLHFGCVFVFGKIEENRFEIPVFKIKGEQNQTLFVDSHGRVYQNWQDYLDTNRLPKCMYCYQRGGLYQGNDGQVLADFGTSPAYNPRNEILNQNFNISSVDQIEFHKFVTGEANKLADAIKMIPSIVEGVRSEFMLNWDSPEVQEWKEDARAMQQNMYLRLGDREWDEWDKSDEMILLLKIGFGLYALPEKLPVGNDLGYNREQLENIKRIADVILQNAELGSVVHFACIFVVGRIWNTRFNTPVFKVRGKQYQTLFVDTDCRVYQDWQDYLDSNCLPQCMYCYPRDGLYQGDGGQVLLDFGTSPACDLKNRFFSSLDSLSNVVTFASTAVQLTSLFTVPINLPLLAIVSTAAEVYSASRAAMTLRDRHLHGQSIGLDNPESRAAWLEITSTALSMAQSGMDASISLSDEAGKISIKALRITYDAVKVGSLTLNGLAILNGFISLVDKFNDGTLTRLDVYHFSTSALFFENSLLNVETAEKIIRNTQHEVLNRHCDDLPAPQIEKIFRLLEQVEGRTQMHQNADRIKMIKRIKDEKSFYESLVTPCSDKAAKTAKSTK